jgi:hypothetical protein
LSVKELECDVLDESTGLDSALIVASKKLVMAFLKDNKETEWNGLSMQIAIMSTHEQYKYVASSPSLPLSLPPLDLNV